jgi:hypothetical protein
MTTTVRVRRAAACGLGLQHVGTARVARALTRGDSGSMAVRAVFDTGQVK